MFKLAGIGVTRNGAFAEYVKAPKKYILHRDLSFEEAAFVERSPALCMDSTNKNPIGRRGAYFRSGTNGFTCLCRWLIMEMPQGRLWLNLIKTEVHCLKS